MMSIEGERCQFDGDGERERNTKQVGAWWYYAMHKSKNENN
jgi:hypothetical protein